MAASRTIPDDGWPRSPELGVLVPLDSVNMVRWRIWDSLQALTLVVRQSTAEGWPWVSDAKGWLSVVFSCSRSNDEAEQSEEPNVIGRLRVAFPGRYRRRPTSDITRSPGLSGISLVQHS